MTAGTAPTGQAEQQSRSLAQLAWRRFVRHRLAMGGLVVMVILVLLTLLAPFLVKFPPNQINLSEVAQPPSAQHWLGTDPTGRDIWSRTVYGGRVSLSVGLIATLITTLVGVVIGALSGFYPGTWLDMVLMRFTDVVMTFPPIVIILVLVSITGPGLWNIIFIMGLLGWPGVARLVRGEFLRLREMEFVEAARALGVRPGRIMFRHLLVNAVAPVLVNASFSMALYILTEAGLSYLGLGVPPPTPSWGNMLNVARVLNVLESQPWMWIPPGIFVVVSVLSINAIGDGLMDALDPRGAR